MKTPDQVSRQAMEKFKAAYEEAFGVRLRDDEVKAMARSLLCFFGVLNQQNQGEAASPESKR